MKRMISKNLAILLFLVMLMMPAAPALAYGNTEGSDAAAEKITDEETRTFTVKWMLRDDENDPLETDKKVAFGTLPSYDGEEPELEADGEYTYEFAGWAAEPDAEEGIRQEDLPAVTEDTVYYAVFTRIPADQGEEGAQQDQADAETAGGAEDQTDTETEEGSQDLSDAEAAGESPEDAQQASETETEKPAPAKSLKLANTAPKTYTVKFTDGQGKTLSTQTVEEGKSATAPKTPTRKGYDFNGWDKAFSNVTANITVNAKWAAHVHKYGAWTVTKQANYFQTGTRVRKCACGATQTQTVAKLIAKNRWIGYGGKLYYFDGNGKLYKGWHKMVPIKSNREQWCYFNRNTGAFVKGIVNTTKNKWVEADGYRFYFYYKMRPIGAGFQVINGRLYYMDKWDAMMRGTFRASDGKTYTANNDGTIWGMPYYIHKYKTFILIDKSDQRLYYYVDKSFNMSAGVVTGLRGVYDTPRGTYYVRSKLRNIYLTGPTWRSYVNYWMAFIGSSYGMHDATWRSSGEFYDNSTYLYDGSHGCVNMSLQDASKLYYRVDIGTTVIVQE